MARKCESGGCCECCKVKCTLCDREFANEGMYMDQIIKCFDIPEDLRSFAPVSKTRCSKRLSSAQVCPHCPMTFNNLKGLNQHIGKVHDESSKNCVCSLCNKTFKTKYAVKFHVLQVHEKSTKVRCPLCPKTLYNKYMLKKHINAEHAARTS
jgi:hypothetical protein